MKQSSINRPFDHLKPETVKRIWDYATGSLYRMNASTAQYYHFTCIAGGKSWQGGYTWSPEKTYGDKHVLNLQTGELIK